MTTELTQCLNDLSLPHDDLTDSISTFTEPSQELLDWCVGGPPINYHDCYIDDHPMAQCSQLNPIRDSPWSPPPEEQTPATNITGTTKLTHGMAMHTLLGWELVSNFQTKA